MEFRTAKRMKVLSKLFSSQHSFDLCKQCSNELDSCVSNDIPLVVIIDSRNETTNDSDADADVDDMGNSHSRNESDHRINTA